MRLNAHSEVEKRNTYVITGSLVFSDLFAAFTSNQWGGARMPRADWKLMKQFNFACQEGHRIEAFKKQILPIWEMGATNQKQNQELTVLRDWLLPMLMNDQVTVG